MSDETINMDNVKVSDDKSSEKGLTDLQIYGITGSVVKLLSKIRKYTILTQIQLELINKPHKTQYLMREIYQFEETKMVMDIREEFDMFYVYGRDEIVIRNAEMLREQFEQAVTYVSSNMTKIDNVMDKNYIEILDSFSDKLQQISTSIATKSIFDEHFKI